MSRRTGHGFSAWIAVVALVSSTTACRGASNPDDPYRSAASGLCEASTKADKGDVDGAGKEFYDTAHQPLHDLAAEVSDVDRAVAARLLEAKEAVESSLEGDQSELGDSFHSLIAAADQALTATGHSQTPCSPAEGS